MRYIGLDVHRDWCDVAIYEDGDVRSCGRVATAPDQLELFAQSLAPDDHVALETTGNALSIARMGELAREEVHLAQAAEDRRALIGGERMKLL